jgi:L-alanine-DL-glutamate epimerase-like enolase superfamily enzyme
MWLSATIDDLHKEAEGLLEQGFRAIKMHVGLPDPARMIDVETVAAASARGASVTDPASVA